MQSVAVKGLRETFLAATTDFSIGEIAQRTGVHIETVRYYEKAGLLPPPPRTEGGHRLNADDNLKWLIFIRRSRELGFTLDEIRNLLGRRWLRLRRSPKSRR